MRPKLLVFIGTTLCLIIVIAWTLGHHFTYYAFDLFHSKETPLLEQTIKFKQITTASHLTTSTVQRPQPVQLDSLRKQRRDHLLKACEADDVRYHGTYQVPYTVQERMQVSKKHRLLYCGLEKAASSFMKRIFMILNGAEKKSPYDMPTGLAGFGVPNLSDFKPATVPDMLQNSTIVIISRDPYTRLLSAYIDKIFSPNAIFADKIGKFALPLTRKEPSEQSLRCGFDLTFKEFIKYFIQSESSGLHRDNHFAPAYQMCLPCTYDYNYIARTDTLLNDTVYLLSQLGEKQLAENLQVNFTSRNRQDKIKGQPNLLFMFRDKYKGCLSFFDAQRKIWKKMQATGVIDKKSKYPISREESENITRTSFERLLLAAVGDAYDVTVGKQQRKEAAIEAYSTVDKEDLEKLNKIFAPDCKIFNFNCRPSKFFETDPKIKPWYFDLETA
ncbi:carbohydrate sulfotransferase 11-like [Mizuhopecten yessoensis]|uniref:Carbohydrate sulfotransferase n=1 Tax=Mizuhopecten yessoensis TaxID=6573 RepID=A0A210QJV4_MIZYE|nr:carbohydrate sulfotransferase 11-like [Mizuhopecten yessoensis]OWF49033.1 Carbohydrate sulfotransferase 9 [Mizuhopecten yessoensis]